MVPHVENGRKLNRKTLVVLLKTEVGDTIWLDLPTAGKLDSKWEGDGQ